MIQFQNIYLPDGETHMVEWMTTHREIIDGKGTYQMKKIRMAMDAVTRVRTAVDIGGHVGLWSMHLAKRFTQVHAFEPVAAHRDCFLKNTAGTNNIHLHAVALGEHEGFTRITVTPHSSGNSYVDIRGLRESQGITEQAGGDRTIAIKKFDDFGLQDVDFIKVDCEGYEYFALKGGEETILRCKPAIIVEQKPGKAEMFGLPRTGAVTYLQSLGYELKKEIGGDFIMAFGS